MLNYLSKNIGIFFLCFLSLQLNSQDSTVCENVACGCSADYSPAGIMFGHTHNKNEWMVSYRLMYMRSSAILQGDAAVSNDIVFQRYLMTPTSMDMYMHMLMLMYGISDRFTLMLMGQYIHNSMPMEMFASGGHAHSGSSDGHHTMSSNAFSDTRLYVQGAIIKNEFHDLSIIAGLSFPTGNIHIKGTASDMHYPDARLPYMMQTGSGTVDLLPGISYVYKKDRFNLGAQGLGTVRVYQNSVGYKLGNEYQTSLWCAYQILPVVALSARLEGVFQMPTNGRDNSLYAYTEPSANAFNYGYDKISIAPGFTIQSSKGFLKNHKLGVECTVPVYQNVQGIQLNNRWNLNVLYAFKI